MKKEATVKEMVDFLIGKRHKIRWIAEQLDVPYSKIYSITKTDPQRIEISFYEDLKDLYTEHLNDK